MNNKNCKNINSCNSCNSCDYCNFCNSCDFCNSCNSCNSCYSCDFSYGLRQSEKMIFCLGDGKYESSGIGYQKNLHIFNKPVSEEEYKKVKNALDIKNFKLPITKWVEYKNLDKKDQTTTAKQLDGSLKTLSYKDAWAEMWSSLSQEDKNFFKGIINFDAEIFEKITGIKIEEEVSLVGTKVEVKVGDKTYKAIITE